MLLSFFHCQTWEKTNDRLNTLEIGECLLLRNFYFSLSDVEKKSKDMLNTLKTGECLLLRIFLFSDVEKTAKYLKNRQVPVIKEFYFFSAQIFYFVYWILEIWSKNACQIGFFCIHFCSKSPKSNKKNKKSVPKKIKFLNNRHLPVFKVFSLSLRFFSTSENKKILNNRHSPVYKVFSL